MISWLAEVDEASGVRMGLGLLGGADDAWGLVACGRFSVDVLLSDIVWGQKRKNPSRYRLFIFPFNTRVFHLVGIFLGFLLLFVGFLGFFCFWLVFSAPQPICFSAAHVSGAKAPGVAGCFEAPCEANGLNLPGGDSECAMAMAS